jgi:hypothetical protein
MNAFDEKRKAPPRIAMIGVLDIFMHRRETAPIENANERRRRENYASLVGK